VQQKGASGRAPPSFQAGPPSSLPFFDGISLQDGTLATAYGYSPFGMRRSAQWSDQGPLPKLSVQELFQREEDEGFTGHEMLADTGLVHTGGRRYNPQIGRFMSAAPVVQAPGNTQNHNRRESWTP
jgi:RHS repeat-associated protein